MKSSNFFIADFETQKLNVSTGSNSNCQKESGKYRQNLNQETKNQRTIISEVTRGCLNIKIDKYKENHICCEDRWTDSDLDNKIFKYLKELLINRTKLNTIFNQSIEKQNIGNPRLNRIKMKSKLPKKKTRTNSNSNIKKSIQQKRRLERHYSFDNRGNIYPKFKNVSPNRKRSKSKDKLFKDIGKYIRQPKTGQEMFSKQKKTTRRYSMKPKNSPFFKSRSRMKVKQEIDFTGNIHQNNQQILYLNNGDNQRFPSEETLLCYNCFEGESRGDQHHCGQANMGMKSGSCSRKVEYQQKQRCSKEDLNSMCSICYQQETDLYRYTNQTVGDYMKKSFKGSKIMKRSRSFGGGQLKNEDIELLGRTKANLDDRSQRIQSRFNTSYKFKEKERAKLLFKNHTIDNLPESDKILLLEHNKNSGSSKNRFKQRNDKNHELFEESRALRKNKSGRKSLVIKKKY